MRDQIPYSQYERYMYWKFLAKKYFWPGLAVFLLVILPLWSVYTVQPDERAVVLRFGKYYRETDPGLHFKLPFGIDEVYKVQITKIRTEQFGFRTEQAAVRSNFRNKGYSNESLMLSGDLNIAEVDWVVQYRVSEPKNYLFNVREKQKNLRDVSQTVTREIVGDRSIDEVLTFGRVEIEEAVKKKMQEVLDKYKMGVTITLVKLQNVTPPKPVAKSFNEVNEARQEKERKENDAYAESNKIIPKAKGEAEKIVSQAKGYAIEKINTARGDVAKFEAVLKQYKKAKQITRTRLYLETMKEVYQKAGKKIIIDEDMRSVLPLLDLEKFK